MKFKIENLKLKIESNKIIFLLIFVVIGYVALQLPIATIKGSKVPFTAFDLFAPISGAFLGSIWGVLAVIVMQAGNLVLHGFSGVDQTNILKLIATLRFLPMIAGVLYFVLRFRFNNLILAIPLLSIFAFNLHPIGRSVWFYSLFWLIPLAVWPFRERFLLLRSLGSTFCAHAVGGAVWIWAFNLPAKVWVSLIPVVIMERLIFAFGISASYILVNNILGYLSSKKLISKSIAVDKRYLLKI